MYHLISPLCTKSSQYALHKFRACSSRNCVESLSNHMYLKIRLRINIQPCIISQEKPVAEITHYNFCDIYWLFSVDYHYDDVIMTMLASQITSLTVVYSIVYSGVNQRKHQSSASLAFVREIHRGPVNFPHKWPVTRKMFPFDDVIMMLTHI